MNFLAAALCTAFVFGPKTQSSAPLAHSTNFLTVYGVALLADHSNPAPAGTSVAVVVRPHTGASTTTLTYQFSGDAQEGGQYSITFVDESGGGTGFSVGDTLDVTLLDSEAVVVGSLSRSFLSSQQVSDRLARQDVNALTASRMMSWGTLKSIWGRVVATGP